MKEQIQILNKEGFVTEVLLRLFVIEILRNLENCQVCPCEVSHASDNLGVCGGVGVRSLASYITKTAKT